MMKLCFGRCDANKIQKNVPHTEFNGMGSKQNNLKDTVKENSCAAFGCNIYGETMLWNM